jgi:hypothetical protein
MISKNTVLAFLIFSAVLLGCILIAQNTMKPATAYGSNIGIQSGNYLATTAQASGSEDLLWMLKTDDHLLMACQFERNGRISILGVVNLELIFSNFRQMAPSESPAEQPSDITPVPRRRR